MKKGIHPNYGDATITCSCGEAYKVRSTEKNIKVEICRLCHPFFSGKMRVVDTAGRIEKFKKKYKMG